MGARKRLAEASEAAMALVLARSCDCTETHRCATAEGLWAAANAVYYSQGYDAWQKALEPYNEHNERAEMG